MNRSPAELRADAETAIAGLPGLMLSAERLAASATVGAHGKRRPGSGEDFWQYRPATAGDTARSIDWRRSARSDAQFVRDREAEVAQSAVVWVSSAAGMDFAGAADPPRKVERANLIALALSLALLGSGERVGLAGQVPRAGRAQAERIGQSLISRAALSVDEDAPPPEALRPGQRVVLIDDFLGDPAPVLAYLERAAGSGVRGAMLQLLDPVEEAFPYSGAVLFRSGSGVLRHDTRDAGGIRDAYLARLDARRALLGRAAHDAGWHFGTHDTAAPPSHALLWLWSVLEG